MKDTIFQKGNTWISLNGLFESNFVLSNTTFTYTLLCSKTIRFWKKCTKYSFEIFFWIIFKPDELSVVYKYIIEAFHWNIFIKTFNRIVYIYTYNISVTSRSWNWVPARSPIDYIMMYLFSLILPICYSENASESWTDNNQRIQCIPIILLQVR